MTATVGQATKGCVVRFKSHALRVETEPLRQGNRIRLQGRENRDGCPIVTRWYFTNQPCTIEATSTPPVKPTAKPDKEVERG